MVTFARNANQANGRFQTSKQQGLNLDTLAGFHFINVGLPGDVPPHAFRDVRLNYPIFVTESDTRAETSGRCRRDSWLTCSSSTIRSAG